MNRLRTDPRPLYARASEVLEEFIAGAELSPGDRMPPEAQLAKLLGVSRGTVREGLRELELRGRVRREHGRGTTVAAPRIVTGLSSLESLESLAAAQGWECGTFGISVQSAPVPAAAAEALGIEAGAPATWLRRGKSRDARPIAHMVTWLPPVIAEPEALRAAFTTSITDLFIASHSPHLEYAKAGISAAGADAAEAEILRCPVGSPLVVLYETFFDGDRPICWSRSVFVPDSVAFELIRRPDHHLST